MDQYHDLFRWILHSLQGVAVFFGFYYWKKLKTTYWKWFPFYLLFILLAEIMAEIFIWFPSMTVFNPPLYIYFVIPIEFLFFYWLFYQANTFRYSKTSAMLAGSIFTIVYVTELLFMQESVLRIPTLGYSIGVIGLLVLCIAYLIRLVQSEELLFFKSQLLFWVSCGLLLFYLGALPFYGLPSTLQRQISPFLNSFYWLMLMLNCLMYLLFSIGMIWKDRK